MPVVLTDKLEGNAVKAATRRGSDRTETIPFSESPEGAPSAERSANMARIGSADTSPELAVRSLLHRLGYRFRLHRRSLPGTPDICFPGRRKAIFVHGCFWHRHEGCRRTTTPMTRTSFWKDKFRKNVERDRANLKDLVELGWHVMVIWQCETAALDVLGPRLARFLDGPAPQPPEGTAVLKHAHPADRPLRSPERRC